MPVILCHTKSLDLMIESLLTISRYILPVVALNFALITSSAGQVGMWTWMKGSDAFYDPGGFGIKGVPAADNTPPNLYGPAVWTDLNGKFWLFGGLSNFSIYNTMWQF